MKNEEILKKAIEKAIKNGFVMDEHKHFCEIGRDELTGEILSLGAYQSIIFSHEFAKAFWGEEDCCAGCGSFGKFFHYRNKTMKEPLVLRADKKTYYSCCQGYGYIKDWQYHLQQMILEENPIKYLDKFIN